MIKLPHFETEREEADWWYDNRALLEAEFSKRLKDGIKPGPSRALQRMAEMRGVTVEELREQHYAKQDKLTEAEALAKLPRSA